MRHTVTYDHGADRTELERIYDRLRKASWRQYWQYDRSGTEHSHYIRGLKDALNAVRESRGQ